MKKCMKLIVVTLLIIIVSGLTFASCDKEEPIYDYGTFYTLQEAYDLGYIDMQDLKSIAYYQNHEVYKNGEFDDEGFVPIPKDPQYLTNEQKQEIIDAFIHYCEETEPNINMAYVTITMGWYYGTYNGNIVAMLGGPGHFPAIAEKVIEGVSFFHAGGPETIYVWVR